MQRAFSQHPGKFTAKAKRANMGVQAFADKVLGSNSKADTTTKREANAARTAKLIAQRRKRRKA